MLVVSQVDSDIALALLRSVLARRPEMKLVLMSATLDAELFCNYFGGAPCMHIPGRFMLMQIHRLCTLTYAILT